MAVSTGELLLAANALTVGVNALILCAAVGLPFIGVTGEIAAASGRTAFFRNLGRQLSGCGVLTAIYALLVSGAAIGLTVYRAPDPFALPWTRPSLLLGGVAAGWLLLVCAHAGTWKSLKDKKPLHIAIGVLAAVLGPAVLFGLAGLSRTLVASLFLLPAQDPTTLLPPAASLLWPAAGWALAMAPACAGGIGLAWVLSRRSRDDWGRDYYAFALSHTARWAAIGSVLQFAALGWAAWSAWTRFPALLTGDRITYAAAGAALAAGLAAVGLFFGVAASTTPLRQKPLAILGLVCLAVLAAAVAFLGIRLLLAL